MNKTILNFPDDDEVGSNLSNKKENRKYKLKFNEDALCRAYINKFYTMGILTSSETGAMLGVIGNQGRQSL